MSIGVLLWRWGTWSYKSPGAAGGPHDAVPRAPNVLPHPHLSRHLFAIANVAYSKVLDAKHNQCIVIR